MQVSTIPVQEQAVEIIEESKALTVSTVSARQRAADLWDALRAFRKQAEAQKEEVIRPLKTAWEQAKKPFDEFVKECQGHEAALQKKMGEWDRGQERIAREEQAKIQAKIDEQNRKKLEKAEAKGKDLAEVVLKVAPVVQAPQRSIETQAGTTQQRIPKKVYHIKGEKDGEILEWDASMKPVADLLANFPQLFVLDRVKFNALAKTGMLDAHSNVSIEETFFYAQRR
jgi:hypothetical protein